MEPITFTTYRTSKQRLMNRLRPFGPAEFARIINPIIADVRNVPLEAAKTLMYLQTNEVTRFLQKIGEPLAGYGKEISLDTARMAKQDLRRLVPTMGQPEFNLRLARIVAENRDMDPERAKYKKYLHGCEVILFLKEIGEKLPGTYGTEQKKELQGVELV